MNFSAAHRTAAMLLATLAAAGGGAGSSETHDLPLLQSGRILHYRGRSAVEWTRPQRPVSPQMGYLFAALSVLPGAGEEPGRQDHGLSMDLAEEALLYAVDGTSRAAMSQPRERRRQQLRLSLPDHAVEVLGRTTAARTGPDTYGPEQVLVFTDDGFDLPAAGRRAAGLHAHALPVALAVQLLAGQTVEVPVNIYLQGGAAGADTAAISAVGKPPPPGALSRVTGRTTLRPRGREGFKLAWRAPPPPRPAAGRPPQAAAPDRHVSLPALLVEVVMELEIEDLTHTPGHKARRYDRLTWTILDDPTEPWILAWEGTIELRRGDPADPEIRSGFAARSLVRVDEAAPASLDAPAASP